MERTEHLCCYVIEIRGKAMKDYFLAIEMGS